MKEFWYIGRYKVLYKALWTKAGLLERNQIRKSVGNDLVLCNHFHLSNMPPMPTSTVGHWYVLMLRIPKQFALFSEGSLLCSFFQGCCKHRHKRERLTVLNASNNTISFSQICQELEAFCSPYTWNSYQGPLDKSCKIAQIASECGSPFKKHAVMSWVKRTW